MTRVSGPALLLTAFLVGDPPAAAQPDHWHTLSVPLAAFEVAGIPLESSRSQLLLRMIRVLHTLPPGHPGVQSTHRAMAALLRDVDGLLTAMAGLPGGEIAVPGDDSRGSRDAVRGALEAAGLRLRERGGRFVVEEDDEGRARLRRERLLSAGFDAASLIQRVNAGEAVRISLGVAELPLPLAPDVWAQAVFRRPVPPEALFSAIISDRSAALLYYGLCALTPETRAFLSDNPDLLHWIYRHRAGTLASYGGSLRVVKGRVDLPGGEDARPVWESLTGKPAARPAEFLREVLDRGEGRLAYLYESIDTLDPLRQRFALGLALADVNLRADRLRALYRVFSDIEAEWAHAALPFSRPMYDSATLLQIAHVTADGDLSGPKRLRLWRRAFESIDLPDDPDREVRGAEEEGDLDAAAIAELVALSPARFRRERFEAFGFGQRVFASASDDQLGDVLVALRGFARFPSVMLVLERLGVTSPAVYAGAARHALALERVDDPARHIPLQAQFQGALAILDRLARTGRVEATRIVPLLQALLATPPDGSRGYGGAVATWVHGELLPAIAPAGASQNSAERTLLAAFADGGGEAVRRFEWEGLAYEVDVAAAERQRIGDIRAKQGGNSLDAVLAFARDVAALSDASFPMERIKPAVASLQAHASALQPPRAWPGTGNDRVPDAAKAIQRAVRDLSGIREPRHVSRAARAAEPLIQVADYLLGEVLVALVYAPLLGDPADLVGGEADVAHKHDFGAGTGVNAEARKRTPWLRPRQPNNATVAGAVLGLDLALAPRTLRRLASDRVPDLPRMKQNDRDVFTTSVALMNPRRLSDVDLHAVARAVKDGRARVSAAGVDGVQLDGLAGAARMSPSRRQLLGWAVRHEPDAVQHLFSIMELFQIGVLPAGRTSHEAFGLAEEPLTGCYCSRFPAPGPWEVYSGRPGTGQLATRVPDLTLRVAELLDELNAPAALLPSVLSLATQDFIDEVPILYADDWPAAVAHAGALQRERVEDYVASLTAGGPLRPISSSQP